jgi:hypothetical protein
METFVCICLFLITIGVSLCASRLKDIRIAIEHLDDEDENDTR